MKHFNELKEKLEELPDVIKDYVKKLDKKIDRVLEQVKDRNIQKTNNLVKLFFKVTFPGKIKRIYRTYEGALNKIKIDDLRWIEKNVWEAQYIDKNHIKISPKTRLKLNSGQHRKKNFHLNHISHVCG